MYTFIAQLAKVLLRSVGKIKVDNQKAIPSEEGTHKGWLDVVIFGICLPYLIHFIAKQELF